MRRTITILFFLLALTIPSLSDGFKKVGEAGTIPFCGLGGQGSNLFAWAGKDLLQKNPYIMESYIKITTDGGETWQDALRIRNFPDKDSLFGLNVREFTIDNFWFLYSELMIAGFNNTFILKSTNLGKSWNITYIFDKSISLDSMEIRDVSMYDKNNGIMSFYNFYDRILATHDGWNTFEKKIIPDELKAAIHKSKAFDSSSYAMLCYYGYQYPDPRGFHLLLTSDGGKSWIKQSYPMEIGNPKVNFKYKDEYWICGTEADSTTIPDGKLHYANVIYKTTDAGKTWINKMHVIESPTSFEGIEFADSLHGIATTRFDQYDRHYYYYTTDGGELWQRYMLDTAIRYMFPMEHISYPSAEAFYCDFKGSVYKIWPDRGTPTSMERQIIDTGEISIYPNPARKEQTIYIHLNHIKGQFIDIMLYSAEGGLIDSFRTDNIDSDDQAVSYEPANDMTPGIYFMKISTGAYLTVIKKIIIY